MAYKVRQLAKKDDRITVISNNTKFHFTPSNPWVAVDWRKRNDIELEIGHHRSCVREDVHERRGHHEVERQVTLLVAPRPAACSDPARQAAGIECAATIHLQTAGEK